MTRAPQVHSAHDVHFKALNSQLLKEVAQFEADAGAPGRRLLDAAAAAAEEEAVHGAGWQDEQALAEAEAAAGVHDTMREASRLSGRTLRQLAGGAAVASPPPAAAGRLAAEAALRRWRQQQQQQQQGPALSGPMNRPEEEEGVHYDPATEAAEQLLRRMGSLDVANGGEGDALAEAAEHQHQRLEEEQRRAEALGAAAEAAAAGGAPLEALPAGGAMEGAAAATHGAGTSESEGTAEGAKQAPSSATIDSMDISQGLNQLSTASPAASHQRETQPADPAVEKLRAARLLLVQLDAALSASGASRAEPAETLDALHSILSRLVLHPGEARYRRLRMANAAFQRRVSRHPPALQLLQLAGFEAQGQGDDAALVFVRNDPGLVYLMRAAVQELQEQQSRGSSGSSSSK